MNSWTPESLLAVTRGFVEARVVLTAVELDLFTLLSRSPTSLEELISALKTTSRGTAILVDALAGMGLLIKRDDRYACPEEIARFLSADSPATVLPMARHAASLWGRWSELTNIVREGAAERPPAVFEDKEELAAFIGAMHVIGKRLAETVAAQVQTGASTNLLDIGGATGTYAQAFRTTGHTPPDIPSYTALFIGWDAISMRVHSRSWEMHFWKLLDNYHWGQEQGSLLRDLKVQGPLW